MAKKTKPPQPRRQSSGIDGLDAILRGGLFKGGIYIVSGPPGVGKTILGNQAAFRHAATGGRPLYVTLLAETHAQMLMYMQGLAFYDAQRVGDQIRYLSAYKAIDGDGLDGFLKLLRHSVREHRSDLLVIDGMMTAESFAGSAIGYKKFIHELQVWVGLVGCTVLLLTSTEANKGRILPAYTMVDGIIELRSASFGPRSLRQVAVTKFRGSEYNEGSHDYRITAQGIRIFPRLESMPAREGRAPLRARRIGTGIDGLDRMFRGGYPASSSTLVLGSSGSGKTLFGIHFLEAGGRSQEKGIYFGFWEKPDLLRDKAVRLGLELGTRRTPIEVVWQAPFDALIDELGQALLERVDQSGATRVVIDGLAGFATSAAHPARVPGFFAILLGELAARGVTTVVTEETRELFVRQIEVPLLGIAAVFENIIFLRQVEEHATLGRLVTVMKSRETDHDRGLRSFDITDRGVVIGEQFSAEQSLMTGLITLTDADSRVRPGAGAPQPDPRRGSR